MTYWLWQLEKLTPAELAGGLRGAHLFPQKRPPQPGSKGSLDGSEASSDDSIGFGPVPIGLDPAPTHAEGAQGGEGGSTLASLFPAISTPPSPDRLPGSARLPRGGPKGPSVGHNILAARDRQQHDGFVAQMGLPQVLKPAVQQAAVASAFSNKNSGLQRPAVTVVKPGSGGAKTPPRTTQPRTPGPTNNPTHDNARA